ncbi:MAG TPA: malto-oligosyltrehalose trehalohydrolase [Longimicrobiaceae bacterium]|nr:malto-oligosyltrehalose trehalohydrolase [Longimicrobiaceae bacterium]
MDRRLPVGAEAMPGGGVHFRVWAPGHERLELEVVGAEPRALAPEGDGYFAATAPDAGPGSLYRFRVDGEGPFPDPASRFQPDGPHGPSRVEDPSTYAWTDSAWRGLAPEGQVLYELHVGTFTPEGTWAAAAEQLPALAELGVTAIELMPVADFPGDFGWGYDGVDLFAPTRLYGSPDALRRFVDRAHALGLGVVLDVVYNHLGPDGNYLSAFSPHYFSDRHEGEWGDAINFDGPGSGGVREFYLANVEMWIREYHLDGLRLDATQQIFDRSPEHVLHAIARTARAAAGDRAVLLIAENEPQDSRLVRAPDSGGFGLDALWNDDLHHSALVAATGRREAYYQDYSGSPQELISALRWGFLFQGQYYSWQKGRRGTASLDLPATAFVAYLQNHDQVANSARGARLHQLTAPGLDRALTALLLLGPATPMLFQGEEFAADAPFLYFADHGGELARSVREGRAEFLSQFRSIATPTARAALADPSDPETFRRCKLDPGERERHPEALALHRDLIRLRRTDPVFRAQRSERLHGAILGPTAFVIRFLGDAEDRLLLVNLGAEQRLASAAEPLLAPDRGRHWRVLWHSDDPLYGGPGIPDASETPGLLLTACSAVALAPGSPLPA